MQSLLLWWNTSCSKRFLFSVTCIWFCSTSFVANSWLAEEGITIVCIFIWMQCLNGRSWDYRGGGGGGAVLTLSTLLISLLSGQYCPLVNLLWLSKACIQTVWDCFCLLNVPLHYPTQPCCTLIIRLYVEREINIILCLMMCVFGFIAFIVFL